MTILAGWILVLTIIFLLYLLFAPFYAKVGRVITNFFGFVKNKSEEEEKKDE